MTPLRLKLGKTLLLSGIYIFTLLIAVTGGFYHGRNFQSQLYEKVFVSRVIDGDTIELEDGRRVRYIGVDTPEINHPTKGQECFGIEATTRNQSLVEGKVVELQSGVDDIDQYGRFLRYVYVDGVFVNAQLIAEGFGYASFYGPEQRFRQVFVQLQQLSKFKNNGLWNTCL